jgi:hypothetical protein
MKMVIDTSPTEVLFHDRISDGADGLFQLANSLNNAPMREAQMRDQRQKDDNEQLFRTQQLGETRAHNIAEEGLSGDRNEVDRSRVDAEGKRADTDMNFRNAREDRIAGYENDRVKLERDKFEATKAKPPRPGANGPGAVAPSQLVNHLTTQLVPVPQTDLFGQPVKGADGKPVMTYKRQPRPDAEQQLRAAGIDPGTLRFVSAPGGQPNAGGAQNLFQVLGSALSGLFQPGAGGAPAPGVPGAGAAPPAAGASPTLGAPTPAAPPAASGGPFSWSMRASGAPGVNSLGDVLGGRWFGRGDMPPADAAPPAPAAAAAPAAPQRPARSRAQELAGEASVSSAIPDLAAQTKEFVQRSRDPRELAQLREAIAAGDVASVQRLFAQTVSRRPSAEDDSPKPKKQQFAKNGYPLD